MLRCTFQGCFYSTTFDKLGQLFVGFFEEFNTVTNSSEIFRPLYISVPDLSLAYAARILYWHIQGAITQDSHCLLSHFMGGKQRETQQQAGIQDTFYIYEVLILLTKYKCVQLALTFDKDKLCIQTLPQQMIE